MTVFPFFLADTMPFLETEAIFFFFDIHLTFAFLGRCFTFSCFFFPTVKVTFFLFSRIFDEAITLLAETGNREHSIAVTRSHDKNVLLLFNLIPPFPFFPSFLLRNDAIRIARCFLILQRFYPLVHFLLRRSIIEVAPFQPLCL